MTLTEARRLLSLVIFWTKRSTRSGGMISLTLVSFQAFRSDGVSAGANPRLFAGEEALFAVDARPRWIGVVK